MTAPSVLERAFELARSGEFRSVAHIRARLRLEGYDSWAVQGRALQQQLKAIIADSRRLRAASAPPRAPDGDDG